MTDEKLVKLAQSKDKAAQRALYDRFGKYWFVLCQRYMSNTQDAEDALQNALIQLFSKLDKFDPARGRFSSWSARVVVNECLILLRSKKRVFTESDLNDAAEVQSNDTDIIERLSTKELLQLVQSLPIGYRTVFNMFVLEGYSHVEIAEELNIAVSTSKSQLFKAKKMLKKKLEVLFNV